MRTRPNRAFAAVMAMIFLLLGAGDLFGLRACPHHEAAGHGHAAGGMHAQDAHADHGDGDHGEHSAPEATHEPCSCAGFCPTTSAIGLPQDDRLDVAPADVATSGDAAGDHGVDLSRLIPYFLPYSQAPPSDG